LSATPPVNPQALAIADLNQDSTVQQPRMDLVIGDADPNGLAVRTPRCRQWHVWNRTFNVAAAQQQSAFHRSGLDGFSAY
jgi:hypothetical protein